jgi:hypothetical protein
MEKEAFQAPVPESQDRHGGIVTRNVSGYNRLVAERSQLAREDGLAPSRRLPLFALLAALALASGALAAERVELRDGCPRDAGDTCFGDLGTLDPTLLNWG